MSNKQLKVFRVCEDAKLPTNCSAGYELYTSHSGCVNARSRALISTGVVVDIPIGYCGQLWSRPVLSIRNGVDVGASVVDTDYPGELKVVLYNHSDVRFTFKKHTRIAQLLIIPIITPRVVECNSNMKTF